jgi:hypothetical protein
MASFRQLYEMSRKPGRDFWDHRKDDVSSLDDQAMSIVLRGLEIRPDRTDGNTFWDDFINVISNNSEGASRLLGVNRDVIAGWSSKVRKAIDRVREENSSSEERANMIQTGDSPDN